MSEWQPIETVDRNNVVELWSVEGGILWPECSWNRDDGGWLSVRRWVNEGKFRCFDYKPVVGETHWRKKTQPPRA